MKTVFTQIKELLPVTAAIILGCALGAVISDDTVLEFLTLTLTIVVSFWMGVFYIRGEK
jgi:hypothetical protein